VLSNPYFTSLQTAKNFNTDFLITYLVHPSTAIYVGYNSNLENLDPHLGTDVNGELNHDPFGRLRNDAPLRVEAAVAHHARRLPKRDPVGTRAQKQVRRHLGPIEDRTEDLVVQLVSR